MNIGMGDCRELKTAKDRAVCQLHTFTLDLNATSNNLSKGGIFDVVKLRFAVT